MADLAAELLKLEGEKIEVVPDTSEGKAKIISDEDLDALLDRSPEVFSGRSSGWTSANKKAASPSARKVDGKKTAFAVYEAPTEEGNDALAMMFNGEDHTGDE
jgi:ATP-dependent DNA helicase